MTPPDPLVMQGFQGLGERLALTKMTRLLRALQWRSLPAPAPGLHGMVYESEIRDEQGEPLRLRIPLRDDQRDCSIAIGNAVLALADLLGLHPRSLAATLALKPGLLELAEIGERLDAHLETAVRHGLPVGLVLLGVPDALAASGAAASIALRLRSHVRGADDVGLASGDSVAAIFPLTDRDGVEAVVQRIRSWNLVDGLLDIGVEVVPAGSRTRPSTRSLYASAKLDMQADRERRAGARE